ncbi:Crp/Fnr family transcriptional regulator [Pedobacter sp. MR2016-19]|uniref:Crp/Fnr family transcriptional regulator n=1 Tax=Pedobacter sp. MR2016-19 TaxID=2780089 RepID=UPI0018747B14|nr:Crp/Fnr family transcriptional regulator [Pedobacter sp. MR2016-19]MBE5320339.1 Crp/Fnr family transcriptional regulator [Pedobacter sp. MR2016-19]
MEVDQRLDSKLDAFKKACIQVLPGLQQKDFDLITPHLRMKLYDKGDLVLSANQVCDHIFFLNIGFVRMYYLDDNGNQINYRFTEDGNFFVDFQSFLTKKPSRFSWEAMQKIEVITIAYQAVQEIYLASNTWNIFGRVMAEQVYLQLNERVEMLLFMQPEERYLQMLLKYPNIINQLPQLHIASYLGIKPETLSRIRKRIVKR